MLHVGYFYQPRSREILVSVSETSDFKAKLNMCFLLKHKSGECQKNQCLNMIFNVQEYAEEGEHRSHGANPI